MKPKRKVINKLLVIEVSKSIIDLANIWLKKHLRFNFGFKNEYYYLLNAYHKSKSYSQCDSKFEGEGKS
jgi:hypothetical protein